MDFDKLADSMIDDLNNLLKNAAAGQYIRVCVLTTDLVAKIQTMRSEIRKEHKEHQMQIEDLQQLNNELAEKAFQGTTEPAEG